MRIRVLVFLVLVALLGGLKAQTGPEIEVLTPDVCVPGKVSMRVKNCSSCASYEWEVGSGTGYKFAGNNFSTIINDSGWYNVSVKIVTSSGATVLIGTNKAFYGRQSPQPTFSLSKSTLCYGIDSVTITDNTPRIKSRDWMIDGKIYYNAPAQMKFAVNGAQGYKSIYLLVRDSWDCKGKVLNDTALGLWDSIKAQIVASKTRGCAPSSVNYALQMDSGKHKILSYAWKFQGASPATSSQRAPKSVLYALGDTFDTEVKINTDRGCSYTYRRNNIISFGDTSLMEISISKIKACANEPLQLSVTKNKTSSPFWEVTQVLTNEGPQQGTTVVYSFKDTGNPIFTVFENLKGCVSTAQFTTKVVVEGPVARITSESPFYCGYPKNLVFTNNSDAWPGGTSWQWKLWNGSASLVARAQTKNFSYNTSTGENYSVFLKATGSNGCADSVMLTKASVYGHIDTNFTVNPNPTCPGKSVTLKPAAGGGSPTDPNKYVWTVYDKSGKKLFTDGTVNPVFTFPDAGTYSAKMVVSNNSACKDSLRLNDTIHVMAPSVSITVPDSMICTRQILKVYAKYNVRTATSFGFWSLQNIDSAGGTLLNGGDSSLFYPTKTGRYKLFFAILDTAKNACTYGYTYPNLIYVSGITVKVTPPNNYGCAPLPVNLTSTVVENVNYESTSSKIDYKWRANYPGNLTFSSTNTASTSATAITEAEHYATIRVSNQSGCMDSAYASLNTTFQAAFMTDWPARCVNQGGHIINLSTKWATNYQYTADPSIIFTPSGNIPEPGIRFTKPGFWPIRLVISDGACRDTVVYNFEIFDIHADFYTPDSISYCAPRLVNFINNTKNVVYNKWKFGDGDSSNTMFNDLAAHLYLTNNSNPGYDVTLIAMDQFGCADTLTKKAHLRLIGPVPDFSINNKYGCEPLKVTFKNNSKDYSQMYLDYDNGVVLDSNELVYHNYYVTNKALPSQKFIPKLLLIDTLGCSALSESKDTIHVLKSAEAKFTFTSINFLRNTEGCANQLLVKYTNTSRFFLKTKWDFNSDGVIDIQNQNAPSYMYDKAGVFFPTLIAEHQNGCKDTFSKDSIVVWEPPVANFTSSADTTCAVDPVRFKAVGTFKSPIVKYNWNFGEIPLYVDTSSQPNPTWKYTTPFNHSVTFQIEDSKGCKDQVVKNIYVNDTAGPVKPQLAYITVRDDKYVDYYWRQSKLGNFFQYHVMLDSLGLWERFNSFKRKDTSFSVDYGAQVFNRRFCFTTAVEDTCNQKGKAAISHCTIVLRDTAFEPFNIRLNWLAYDWWENDLSHYEIFRKEEGSNNYVRIATVKNNRLSYTDSFLCDKKYTYYVEAVHVNEVYRSRSNTVTRKAIYVKPDSSSKTTLVTVVDNKYTQVSWEPYYKYYRKWSFILERSSNGLPGSFSKVGGEVIGTSATDFGASVFDRINYYRVTFKDHCGVTSEPGLISNSIWLRVNTVDRNNSKLYWNAYNYWHSGVKEYGVQLRDENGVFKNMVSFGGSTLGTESIDIEKLELDSICFRVYAVKDTATSDTSWSNELCLVPASYVHVPTAFSPDKNNLNEVFKPVLGFVHKELDDQATRYEFRVLNRWGQVVFETNNPAMGWDGSFDGKLCPNGLYIWTLKAVGYDGVAHRQDGTVYLLH